MGLTGSTMICFPIIWTSALIRKSKPLAARIPFASRCCRTARASNWTYIRRSTWTKFFSARLVSRTFAIPAGRPWIYTACEDIGASVWWPNKDQWRDEVENMQISVAIPSGLVDVSNGKFVGKTDLGDGYTRWDWLVQYPVNSYDVALNIGNYVHFSDQLGDLPLDFYVLPEDLDKAKKQFVQAKGMIEAYQHYFGEYPFQKDGYKLIEVPYSGMEHQSAVTYGNHFTNGYLGRDWTGVGVSPKFDFIIIHESGHE